MTDRNGLDLTSGMQYVSPDDGNAQDMTVMKVLLPGAARPGDAVFTEQWHDVKITLLLPH